MSPPTGSLVHPGMSVQRPEQVVLDRVTVFHIEDEPPHIAPCDSGPICGTQPHDGPAFP